MTRRYRFNGLSYCQRPLTYGQFEKLYAVTKGTQFGPTPNEVGSWIDRMMEQRLLPQIARIVLTPYEPTALHRWWNKRRRKKLGITPEDDVEAILSAPEFAEAVADFFVINVGWLESWLNTPMGSGLDFRRSIVKMTPAGAIASLSRSFGQLATATWIRPSASDGSPS